jgi:hypothetical protein
MQAFVLEYNIQKVAGDMTHRDAVVTEGMLGPTISDRD